VRNPRVGWERSLNVLKVLCGRPWCGDGTVMLRLPCAFLLRDWLWQLRVLLRQEVQVVRNISFAVQEFVVPLVLFVQAVWRDCVEPGEPPVLISGSESRGWQRDPRSLRPELFRAPALGGCDFPIGFSAGGGGRGCTPSRSAATGLAVAPCYPSHTPSGSTLGYRTPYSAICHLPGALEA
jgi:hypothetical protein